MTFCLYANADDVHNTDKSVCSTLCMCVRACVQAHALITSILCTCMRACEHVHMHAVRVCACVCVCVHVCVRLVFYAPPGAPRCWLRCFGHRGIFSVAFVPVLPLASPEVPCVVRSDHVFCIAFQYADSHPRLLGRCGCVMLPNW